MFKKVSTAFIFLAIIALFLSMYAFDTATLEARNGNQTIPTRTPEGGGNNGGGNNGGGNNGGGNSGGGGSAPTETPVPSATPTATLIPVTIGPTPEGGYVTATECGPALYVSDQGNANVRSGPGTSYDSMGKLVYLEVRPIIGRSALEEWWYIALADGSKGWVADIAGSAVGIIDGVPTLNSDGTITNGVMWHPTPNPVCPTTTPSPTPPPPATDTPVPADTAASADTAVSTDTPVPTETIAPTDTPAPTATPTATEVPAEPTATELPVEEATSQTETETATASSDVDAEEPTPSSPNWFLIGGGIFILLGAGAFVYQRRGG